jgi:signal peptidase I
MNRVLRELLEAVVLALIVFMVIQTSVRNFKVDGSSMNPTLEGGQYLMVNKLVYFQLDMARLSRIVPFWKVERPDSRFALHPPLRGEVIVFHFPNDTRKDFVKRVIGLPGDTVAIRQGKVFVNDSYQEESHITRKDTSSMPPMRLRAKEYFVMGDNRRSSNDSRSWGPVPEGLILGKVWFVYWPFSSLRVLNNFSWAPQQIFR